MLSVINLIIWTDGITLSGPPKANFVPTPMYHTKTANGRLGSAKTKKNCDSRKKVFSEIHPLKTFGVQYRLEW